MSKKKSLSSKALFSSNPAFLAQQLFKMELSESELRAVPAQSLYLAIKHNGLESSVETILAASNEQLQIILDLDLWHKDTFLEEKFWDWIELEEPEDPITISQKLLKAFDFKLLALIIAKYTEIITFEDQSESPPAPGFYSPDLGLTWVRVTLEDSRKTFLLNRILAIIFESSAEVFYQLTATPSVATNSILEEEAYQDQKRRLLAEGIPDLQAAAEHHQPKTALELEALLTSDSKRTKLIDVDYIPALTNQTEMILPWTEIVANLEHAEELATELTYLTNSGIVYYGIEIQNLAEVRFLMQKIRGAINIAFETLLEKQTQEELVTNVNKIGLRPFYQHGLSIIGELKKTAKKFAQTMGPENLTSEQHLLIDCACQQLPCLPVALNIKELTFQNTEGKISQEKTAFEYKLQVSSVLSLLNNWQKSASSETVN